MIFAPYLLRQLAACQSSKAHRLAAPKTSGVQNLLRHQFSMDLALLQLLHCLVLRSLAICGSFDSSSRQSVALNLRSCVEIVTAFGSLLVGCSLCCLPWDYACAQFRFPCQLVPCASLNQHDYHFAPISDSDSRNMAQRSLTEPASSTVHIETAAEK